MTAALGKVAGKLHHAGTYGARGRGMMKCCIRQYDMDANCSEERATDESSRRVVAIVAQEAGPKGKHHTAIPSSGLCPEKGVHSCYSEDR